MKNKIVILVRHGHYEMDSGRLSELGRRQARKTAQALRAAKPTRLLTSPKIRARETAHLIAEVLKLKPQARGYFIEGALPGSTSFVDLTKRKSALSDFNKAYEFIVKPANSPEVVIIVCRENVIRSWVCKILGVAPSRGWRKIRIGQASVTILRVNADGRVVLLGLSEESHLPISLRSRTI